MPRMHFTLDRLLLLFAVLCGLGVLLWITLAVLMGWAILRPPRMSAGKAIYHLRRLSPGDLGLGFEEQVFTIRDARSQKKLHIAGWWIPASQSSEKCVLLLHGYADAKVGAIAWAPVFHELGWNVLAIDLRAHGESGGSFSTGGYFERDDVTQVIDQLLSLYSDQTRQLILFGPSLGAAVACAVTERRDDIAALVLDSPFADFKRAIAAHTRLMGLPGGLLLRAAIRFAEAISGATFSQVRPVDTMLKVKRPILCIVGADDELLDAEDMRLLQQAITHNPAPVFWEIRDCGHLQAMAVEPEEYHRRIGAFLKSVIAG